MDQASVDARYLLSRLRAVSAGCLVLVGKEGLVRFHGRIYLQKINPSAVSGPPVFHQETIISHLAKSLRSFFCFSFLASTLQHHWADSWVLSRTHSGCQLWARLAGSERRDRRARGKVKRFMTCDHPTGNSASGGRNPPPAGLDRGSFALVTRPEASCLARGCSRLAGHQGASPEQVFPESRASRNGRNGGSWASGAHQELTSPRRIRAWC